MTTALPSDREAEKSVLGAILHDNSALARVVDLLAADSFFHPAHREAFKAMLEMWTARQPIDEITLAGFLRTRGRLEQAGGVLYLAELGDATPVSSNVMAYAEIVQDRQARRELIAAGQYAEAAARDGEADPIGMALEVEQAFRDIGQRRTRLAWTPAARLVPRLDAMARTPEAEQDAGIHTYTFMDRYLGGFTPGFVSLLAARTENGKTALLCHIAEGNASRNVPGALITLEMRDWQVLTRIVCRNSGVSGTWPLRRKFHKLDETQMRDFYDGLNRVARMPLLIAGDGRELTLSEVRYLCRMAVREHGARWIGLDHIKKIKPPAPRMTMKEAQDARILELSEIAKELDVPIVVLAQINREGIGEPTLGDIEGSDTLAQEADAVLLFQVQKPVDNEHWMHFWLAKQRNAAKSHGFVKVQWWPWIYRFQDMQRNEGLGVG